MSNVEVRKPSLGTVLGAAGALMGFIALVVSLSGSADALSRHPLVHKGDIAAGAVTAKTLAPGAVHPKALAKGAVKSKALAKGAVKSNALSKGAVTATALAPNAVTAAAIAPGSVYGGALGALTIHTTPIADIDAVAENGMWTASNTETASCATGEALLNGGFAFTNPGNREVAFLQALPFSASGSSGVSGRITSNSGGSAAAVVQAVCLK